MRDIVIDEQAMGWRRERRGDEGNRSRHVNIYRPSIYLDGDRVVILTPINSRRKAEIQKTASHIV